MARARSIPPLWVTWSRLCKSATFSVLIHSVRVSSQSLCSVVYYNPAKTLGGMVEANIYCLMGLAFASYISLGSMYTYRALEPHAGWEWLADALALIWIGVGMSLVAWFKLWIAKPTFNPGQTRSLCVFLAFLLILGDRVCSG